MEQPLRCKEPTWSSWNIQPDAVGGEEGQSVKSFHHSEVGSVGTEVNGKCSGRRKNALGGGRLG